MAAGLARPGGEGETVARQGVWPGSAGARVARTAQRNLGRVYGHLSKQHAQRQVAGLNFGARLCRRYGRQRLDGEQPGSRAGVEEKIFENSSCNSKLLWYCVGAAMKNLFPKQNKKAVPSHLERVTNQWQPASTGGTAHQRVTHDLKNTKDRNCGGFLPAQDVSKNQVARPMVGQAGISGRKPRCGCSNGDKGKSLLKLERPTP